MAVKLRLTRVGSKKNPIYRVVAADSRSPRDGKFLEIVGRYNPQTDPSTIELDEAKVKDWLGEGRAADRGGREADQDQGHREALGMAELLAYLARELVDDPAAVRVEEEERDGALVLVLHVAPDDVGKVIGAAGPDRARAAHGRARELRARRAARAGRDRRSRDEVAALYDVHAMPWALEAVLAGGRRGAARQDRLRRRLPVRPVPARDGRDDPRARRGRAARQLRGPGRGVGARASSPGDLEWLRVAAARGVSSTASCTATRRRTTTRRSRRRSRPTTRCSATFGETRGTVVHRPHPPSVRPDASTGCAWSTPAPSGMAYESDVAAFWTIIDDGEPSSGARGSTSSARSPRCARAAGRQASEFIAENLLVAVDRDEAIASLESRR